MIVRANATFLFIRRMISFFVIKRYPPNTHIHTHRGECDDREIEISLKHAKMEVDRWQRRKGRLAIIHRKSRGQQSNNYDMQRMSMPFPPPPRPPLSPLHQSKKTTPRPLAVTQGPVLSAVPTPGPLAPPVAATMAPMTTPGPTAVRTESCEEAFRNIQKIESGLGSAIDGWILWNYDCKGLTVTGGDSCSSLVEKVQCMTVRWMGNIGPTNRVDHAQAARNDACMSV